MQASNDHPCRIWWFEGFWGEDRYIARVAPGADYGEEPFRNQGNLSKEIRHRTIEFTKAHGPHSLFVSYPAQSDRRDFDDLGPMTMSGILVSGAMIDLLKEFDLGSTQVLELPMYEGLGKQLSPSSPLGEPDLSRPIPGRWGLLHVRETKGALYDEGCRGIEFRVRKHWLDNPPLMAEVPYRSKESVIALNARIACEGPDIWFDGRIDDVPFISDRLKRAIEDARLRVPTMKWLKEAELYTITED